MPVTLVHVNGGSKERRVAVRDGTALEIQALGLGPNGGVVVVSADQRGMCFLDNRSRVRCVVNGIEVQKTAICPGDRIQIGTEIYQVEYAYGPDVSTTHARGSRRMSVSRLPSVPSGDGRKSFLRRVGRMLALRGQRTHHLHALEAERDRLLRDVGRCALRADAGLGLPEQAIIDLHMRKVVTLQPSDVQPASIERWHQMRQQAALLEAEIAMVRRELNLDPNPDHLDGPTPAIRADQQMRQDRYFAALDDQDTLNLAPDADLLDRPKDQLPPGSM